MPKQNTADERFKEAYKKYYTDVYRFCLSYLLHDRASVDDCVQEVFIVLYKKYQSGEDIEYVKAFLFKTAENFIKKHLRQNVRDSKNVSIDEIIELPSQSEDLDERLSFEEYSRQISAALSDRDAELFKLRYIEELSLEEIAAVLNTSITTIGTRTWRLRKRLMTIVHDIMKD